jgi:hypothetical protein
VLALAILRHSRIHIPLDRHDTVREKVGGEGGGEKVEYSVNKKVEVSTE